MSYEPRNYDARNCIMYCPPSREPPRAYLVVIHTRESVRQVGECIPVFEGVNRIGRGHDCHVMLTSENVSRRHARIEQRDDAWWIVDDGSVNGTFVNAELITAGRDIADGDRLQIASTVLRFFGGTDALARAEEERARLATVDGLTQVATRGRILACLDEEIARARHGARPVSVVVLEVEGLRDIAQEWGEAAADLALAHVAHSVVAIAPSSAIVGRGDADEIAIALPDAGFDSTHRFARCVRERVASGTFAFSGELIPLVVRAGIATWNADDSTRDTLLTRARRARDEGRFALGA